MSITLTPEQMRRLASALTHLKEARPFLADAGDARQPAGAIRDRVVAAIEAISAAIPYAAQHAGIDTLTLPALRGRCHRLLNALQSFDAAPPADDYESGERGSAFNDLHDAILDAFNPKT